MKTATWTVKICGPCQEGRCYACHGCDCDYPHSEEVPR